MFDSVVCFGASSDFTLGELSCLLNVDESSNKDVIRKYTIEAK